MKPDNCYQSLIVNTLVIGTDDGSESKPALRKVTGYMVEKTHHDIAPHLGAFWSYLRPQRLIYGSKGVSIYKNDRWNVTVNSHYLQSVQKAISFCQKPTIWLRKLTI